MLRTVTSYFFVSAKHWMTAGLLLRGAVYIVGLGSIFTLTAPVLAAVLVFLLTTIGEICLLRADQQKGTAESVLRILDLHDSFGTPIPAVYVADILVGVPEIKSQSPTYFASTPPPGPRRALANLQESAWWSKHVARYTWQTLLALLTILVALSIVALVASTAIVASLAHQQAIARVITATLLLIFSLGLLRFVYAYWSFSTRAAQVDLIAQKAQPTGEEAMALWRDYHLARASTPMLPTILWRWKNASLNKRWSALRNPTAD
jgi:hypothetical protein